MRPESVALSLARPEVHDCWNRPRCGGSDNIVTQTSINLIPIVVGRSRQHRQHSRVLTLRRAGVNQIAALGLGTLDRTKPRSHHTPSVRLRLTLLTDDSTKS
jgi:hypothetical protein